MAKQYILWQKCLNKLIGSNLLTYLHKTKQYNHHKLLCVCAVAPSKVFPIVVRISSHGDDFIVDWEVEKRTWVRSCDIRFLLVSTGLTWSRKRYSFG